MLGINAEFIPGAINQYQKFLDQSEELDKQLESLLERLKEHLKYLERR